MWVREKGREESLKTIDGVENGFHKRPKELAVDRKNWICQWRQGYLPIGGQTLL